MYRKCKKCGKAKDMERVLDECWGEKFMEYRQRVCFQCAPSIEDQDDGDMKYHQWDENELEAV